jgi:hypothetical protein
MSEAVADPELSFSFVAIDQTLDEESRDEGTDKTDPEAEDVLVVQ